jgi:hypothetical protein
MRPLFAGFGATTSHTGELLFHLVELFLTMNDGKLPQSITLKRNIHSIAATQLLQNKGVFTGAVAFKLDDLLGQLCKGLSGDSNTTFFGIETFRRLANTNSKLEFENCM